VVLKTACLKAGVFTQYTDNKTAKGNCEVRLSSAFLSFGMAGFDTERGTGYINIQLYSYKTLGETPNIILKRQDDPKWFDYFKNQFELLWADSKNFEKGMHR